MATASSNIFPAWGWWLLGIAVALAVSAIVVCVWKLMSDRHDTAGALLEAKDAETWLQIASTDESSKLNVPAVSVIKVRSGKLHVHIFTKRDERTRAILAKASLVPGSPSGDLGQVVCVTFRDELSGRTKRLKLQPGEWAEVFAPGSRAAGLRRKHLELDIPRRIMQTYRTPYLRARMHQAHQTFAWRNPGFAMCFYGNRAMREFVVEHFGQRVVDALDRLRPGAYKADLFRLCELYVHGGVYADCEMVCVTSLESILSGVDLVVVRDSPFRDLSYLFNAFIAARPRLPFLRFAIEELVARVEKGEYSRDPLSITGPGIFGRGLNRFAGRPETEAHGLGVFKYGDMTVRILDHTSAYVIDTERGNAKVVATRYRDWGSDREGNPYYWHLYHRRKVFLSRLGETDATTGDGQAPVLFQTSESAFMMARQLRTVQTNRGLGPHMFADDAQRRADLSKIEKQLELGSVLTRAYAALLAGGARAHFWGICSVAAYGGVYLDTHARLFVSAGRIIHHIGGHALASDLGIWGAAQPQHEFFLEVLRVALDSILEQKLSNTHSSDWFREAKDCSPSVWARKDGNLINVEDTMTIGELSYQGYNEERVWSGGEDPKQLARLHQVLEPHFLA